MKCKKCILLSRLDVDYDWCCDCMTIFDVWFRWLFYGTFDLPWISNSAFYRYIQIEMNAKHECWKNIFPICKNGQETSIFDVRFLNIYSTQSDISFFINICLNPTITFLYLILMSCIWWSRTLLGGINLSIW